MSMNSPEIEKVVLFEGRFNVLGKLSVKSSFIKLPPQKHYNTGGNKSKRRKTNEKTKENNTKRVVIHNLLAECGQACLFTAL